MAPITRRPSGGAPAAPAAAPLAGTSATTRSPAPGARISTGASAAREVAR
jgi:hypothetical protein